MLILTDSMKKDGNQFCACKGMQQIASEKIGKCCCSVKNALRIAPLRIAIAKEMF